MTPTNPSTPSPAPAKIQKIGHTPNESSTVVESGQYLKATPDNMQPMKENAHAASFANPDNGFCEELGDRESFINLCYGREGNISIQRKHGPCALGVAEAAEIGTCGPRCIYINVSRGPLFEHVRLAVR